MWLSPSVIQLELHWFFKYPDVRYLSITRLNPKRGVIKFLFKNKMFRSTFCLNIVGLQNILTF